MSQPEAARELTVYADYVCPFCYLGYASLETYLASTTEPVRVSWHPFDLRGHARGPDGELREDARDGKGEAYFDTVRENVERLKRRYGVEMALDVAREIDSWDAQRLSLWIRDGYGAAAFEAFHDAVFEALWVEVRDIGDRRVLVGLADDVGLPTAEVREALDDDAGAAKLAEQVDAARRRGITGVPTFVAKDAAARGAVPPEHLRHVLEGD